jgi:hypothetical protein
MSISRLKFVLLGVGICLAAQACKKDAAAPNQVVMTTFTCADTASGGQVGCTLDLANSPGFSVSLDSSSCSKHGDEIRLVRPIDTTVTADACYATVGGVWHFPGPFAVGTHVSMEVVSNVLNHPPSLRVTGAYPTWQAVFEDGYDLDFNDLYMTIKADSTP